MTSTRLLAVITIGIVCLSTGTTSAQISANDAAQALDSLQNLYLVGVADDSTGEYFVNVAARFEVLESQIEAAGLRQSLIDVFDRSRYQRAWCYFRIGEAGGDIRAFDRARSLFDAIRREAVDREAVLYSNYMQGECGFWIGLLRKWKVMSEPPFTEADLQDALQQLQSSGTFFETTAADAEAPDRLRYAASLRLGDIEYERAKIFQTIEEPAPAVESFEACRYQDRDVLRNAGPGDGGRIRDYSDAMRCLWQIFSAENREGCRRTAATPGVYDVAGETIFRQANLLHDSAMTDTSLWAVVDSLYGEAALRIGISEGLYWQGLVRSLKGETDAVSLFEQFVGRRYRRGNLRLKALHDDAQRRIDLENENISADNVADFLRPGDNQYLVDQAIANAKYLIRRAASRITYWGRQPYLDKADAFLLFADRKVNEAGFPDSRPKNDEINFYRYIVSFMAIPRFGDHQRRAEEFENVAQGLARIGHDFELEARYVRAICLYEAWSRYRVFGNEEEQSRAPSLLNQARSIFEDLVRSHLSVRALYRLAEIYRIKDEDSLAAVTCYNTVIEKTKGCPQLSFFKGDCEAAIAQLPPRSGQTAQLIGLNYNQVLCPDYLVPGQNVYWEGLADDQGAMAVFAEESRQLLIQFALPKKNLYPADRRLARSVILDDCFRAAEPFTAQVKDVLRLNPVWDLDVLVLKENGSSAVEDSRIRVTVPGESGGAHELNGQRFVRTDIPLGDNIRAVFTLDDPGGYYPEVKDYLSRDLRGWRVIDTVVLAARTGTYALQSSSDLSGLKHLYRPLDDNVVVHGADDMPFGQAVDAFEHDVRLRDMITLGLGNGSTALLAYSDSGVFVESDGSAGRTPFGESLSRLTSPDGVAEDGAGYVYVVDYGRNRVVKFDTEGNEIAALGLTGVNTDPGVQVSGRLALPTRVVIETDREGLTYNGATVFRAPHILVADHYGLHRFDMLGYYLDSPLKVGDKWPTAGDLSGFDLVGYGRRSLLALGNRRDGKLVAFGPTMR